MLVSPRQRQWQRMDLKYWNDECKGTYAWSGIYWDIDPPSNLITGQTSADLARRNSMTFHAINLVDDRSTPRADEER